MARRRLTLVLCQPRSKRPAVGPEGHWRVSTDGDVVRSHVECGGNVGLVAGARSNLALLDPDNLDEWGRLVRCMGDPAKGWVRTGSGRTHLYIAWEPCLPPKLRSIDGEVIGELQRGGADGLGQQHCLIPPSVHPDTGARYAWLLDPAAEPIAPLPDMWRRWLLPSPDPRARRYGRQVTNGVGPGPALARLLPAGWMRRPGGRVKFPCPQCRADGHDRHGDNAILFADGRFGCAWASGHPDEAPRHRKAIARLLAGRPGADRRD
jgi:hypothetical protein